MASQSVLRGTDTRLEPPTTAVCPSTTRNLRCHFVRYGLVGASSRPSRHASVQKTVRAPAACSTVCSHLTASGKDLVTALSAVCPPVHKCMSTVVLSSSTRTSSPSRARSSSTRSSAQSVA